MQNVPEYVRFVPQYLAVARMLSSIYRSEALLQANLFGFIHNLENTDTARGSLA